MCGRRFVASAVVIPRAKRRFSSPAPVVMCTCSSARRTGREHVAISHSPHPRHTEHHPTYAYSAHGTRGSDTRARIMMRVTVSLWRLTSDMYS